MEHKNSENMEQAETSLINSILTAKDVTVVGIMLAIILFMWWDRRRILKDHKEERDRLEQKLSDAQNKLEAEFKESAAAIQDLVSKYYEVSSQVLTSLKTALTRWRE